MKDLRTEAQYRAELATCWQMIEQGKEYQEKQRVELAAAQAVIEEAAEMVDHWASYASGYYRTKWNFAGDLAFLRAADSTALHDRLRQERERCAKVCEAHGNPGADGWSCAAKIRSMGDE